MMRDAGDILLRICQYLGLGKLPARFPGLARRWMESPAFYFFCHVRGIYFVEFIAGSIRMLSQETRGLARDGACVAGQSVLLEQFEG
jgi:hypothetical protein